MTGWLANDCLTCIPGTKTLWHDLLEWLPNLQDRTGGYTDYRVLAQTLEEAALREGAPHYLIRNATFFPRITIACKTVALLQDVVSGAQRDQQIEVCNHATATVFNSPYTYHLYKDSIRSARVIIPLGTDFEFFRPLGERESLRQKHGILPRSVLFVGDSTEYPKGFDRMRSLIAQTEFNFCLVMKDGFTFDHPRVKVFNRVNHEILREIYNSCDLLVCTSREETLHLAGIEAAACNLPLVTTRVGAYFDQASGDWGVVVDDENGFAAAIGSVLARSRPSSSREHFLKAGLDRGTCRARWTALIETLCRSEVASIRP